MARWTLYHNPSCSKSREALAALRERDVDLEVVEYLKTPLTERELASLIIELDTDVARLVRQKEELFLAAPFDTKDPKTVASRLAETPRLLERPLLRGEGRVTIGRPIEDLLARL